MNNINILFTNMGYPLEIPYSIYYLFLLYSFRSESIVIHSSRKREFFRVGSRSKREEAGKYFFGHQFLDKGINEI